VIDPSFQVTVIISHIPPRAGFLTRAVQSVAMQTHPARNIMIVSDLFHDGSAITRNRALFQNIDTTWVAFLDDDDELLPRHLEVLTNAARETGAQVVYPGCEVRGPDGRIIHRREEWGRFGQEFDAELLRTTSYIPVTSLVRTNLARRALFGPPRDQPNSDYDDWGFYRRLDELGAEFHHVPEVTWVWHHHGHNTSGRSDRW
jgi:hypothetical protein